MLVVVPYMGIAIEGAIAPIGGAQASLEALGDRGRDHIHRTSRSEGAVLHLATPLQHLYGVHASSVGEVISGRGSIGGWSS